MAWSLGGRLSVFLVCINFVLLVSPASGENNSCGALITYNQFSDLLESAPSCFQNGCGAGNLTSMSTTCNPNAPCYPIWNILNKEYQQDWCSNCTGDVACRIPGWPILNATTACDISPNTWIFGNGGCCIKSGEFANLSSWIETLCNDTWRDQFNYYNGMAPEDWDQWRLPWNWTVAPQNVLRPTCPYKPRYLGLFAIENLVFLIFVVIYGVVTLWIIKGKEQGNAFAEFVVAILSPLRLAKKGIVRLYRFVCCLGPSKGDSDGTTEVIGEILLAILFAGIQLAFNFITAYLIKYTPGYEHVPAPLLALLFCCRPRLGWLACWLSATPDIWLENYFHLSPDPSPAYPAGGSLLRGQDAVSRVALSSAMGEIIMQLLGSYLLGTTAHVGTIRGFYWHNHLSPYYLGLEARNMYGGAMFWLAAAFFVILVWGFVVICHAAIMRFFKRTKIWVKNLAVATIPESVQPKRMKSWPTSKQTSKGKLTATNPPRDGDSDIHAGEGLLMRGGAGTPATPGTYGSSELPSGYQNFRGGGSSAFTSQGGHYSPSPYEALQIRPQDFPQATTSSSNNRQGDNPVTQRGGYRALPVSPELQMRPRDFPLAPGQDDAQDRRDNPDFIQRVNPLPYSFPETGYQGVQTEDPDDGVRISEKSPPERAYNHLVHVPADWRELQPFVLRLGIFLGFLSYIAQWLFWAGFVYTAGDLFCPPNLASIGTLWSIAAILGLGSSFSLQ